MGDWDSARKTVLILDDSAAMLEFCRLAFQSAGYRVITRSQAAGSVAAILRQQPDVVLLDINMPRLSGEAIARILSKVVRGRMLLILHSDISLETLRLKAISTGAHGYVKKTTSPAELVHRVEEWFQRSRRSSGAIRAARATSNVNPVELQISSSSSGSQRRGGATSHGARASTSPPAARTSVPSSMTVLAARPVGASSARPSDPVRSAQPARSMDDGRSTDSARPPEPTRALEYVRSSGRFPVTGISHPSRAPASGTVRTPMRVLFADADGEMLEEFRQEFALELAGDYVSSGDDALARILSDTPPDAVVTGTALPGTSGPELYRCARAVDPGLAQRFIFMTDAKMTISDSDFLNQIGARVFYKPISPSTMLDALRYLARGRKAGRA